MASEDIMRQPHQAAGIGYRPGKRKKRRAWRLLAMLAMLTVLVWLLPGIVAHSPLLGWIVRKATTDLNGTVSIQSVSLAWFSPVTVSGVEVKDAEGKTVFSAPLLGSERTLAAILRDSKNLGRFYVHGPKISLVLRNDGSNVEDLLSKYLAPEEEEPTDDKSFADIGFLLYIDDARLLITDEHSGRSWQMEKLSLEIDMSEGPSGAITTKVSAELPDAQRPGKLEGEARMASGAGEATLNAVDVPLAMFRALAARFAPGTTLAGRLSSSVRASWGDQEAGGNRLQADINMESFSLTTPKLQTDLITLDRVHGVCEVTWTPERVEIVKTSLDCDVGSLLFSGTIPLGEKDGVTFSSLIRQRQEFDGQLDLARLAGLLPATLNLRQGMRIDSGQVHLTASSRPEAQGMVWHGQLQAAGLAADAGGRRIAWQQPILAIFEAHDGPRGPVIDSLRCESDFLKVHAAGTVDQLAASFTFSLKRLAEQLGQFVDLDGLQLSGEGSGNLNWMRTPQQQFTAGAELQINDFQLTTTGRQPWRERNLSLSLSLSANGQTDLGENTRIDAAALTLKTTNDQIKARLTGAVADLTDGGSWPVRLDMRGQLQNWPARLAPWLPTGGWRIGGGYTLEAEATASKDNIQLRQMKLTAAPLTVASKSFNANEPRLRATAAGSWDGQQRRLRIDRANFDCATVAVEVNNVLVSMPESGAMEMAGSFHYQTFVDRLKQWFSDPSKPPSWRIAGQLRGTGQLQHSAGRIRCNTDAELLNLAVIDSSGQQFQEPRVKLSVAGDYDGKSKVLQLVKFEITSQALAAGATGRVGPVGDHNEAQIDGRLRYDVERLAGLLRPYLGSGVGITGRGESPFWYRGPFSLATGSAAAGINWDWANVYGFQIGPGQLKAKMADGAVWIEPMDLAVSRGRMRLAPHVRLTPEPIELTLPAGPLMEKVQIDPAMCSTLLKYIAPVLADVTSAQGSFSIVLDACRIPLAEPKKSDLAGRFLIHSVQIGPGPLVRELAMLLGRESPARLRQESTVAFQMKNGRIYHNNLELMFPDLTIRTQGSVGLDQTLDLVAEMPIPPKWLAGNPLVSKALSNQVIHIPLKGTLAKPQLDQREMERLSRQFIKKAAGNLLEGELNKQLDRLFGPRK